MNGVVGGLALEVGGAGILGGMGWVVTELFSGIGAPPESERTEWARQEHHARGKLVLAASALPAAIGAAALLTGRGPGLAMLGAAAGVATVGTAHLIAYRPSE